MLTPKEMAYHGYVILNFTSHRARIQALGWAFTYPPKACYSLRRRSKGGFYVCSADHVERVRVAGVKGVTVLRGPYDDLHWCWG